MTMPEDEYIPDSQNPLVISLLETIRTLEDEISSLQSEWNCMAAILIDLNAGLAALDASPAPTASGW